MANAFTDQPTPSFNSTAQASSYAGADPADSWTPTNGDIVFVFVVNSDGTNAIVPASLSGNGQTWTQIATIPFFTNSVPLHRLTAYRALIAAASAGVLTVDFGGDAQTGCAVIVVSVAGSKTTGNGADAVVQVVTNYDDAGVNKGHVALA